MHFVIAEFEMGLFLLLRRRHRLCKSLSSLLMMKCLFMLRRQKGVRILFRGNEVVFITSGREAGDAGDQGHRGGEGQQDGRFRVQELARLTRIFPVRLESFQVCDNL